MRPQTPFPAASPSGRCDAGTRLLDAPLWKLEVRGAFRAYRNSPYRTASVRQSETRLTTPTPSHFVFDRPAGAVFSASFDQAASATCAWMFTSLSASLVNATSVFLEIPWSEHAFDALPNGPIGQLALYYTERFLAWALTRASV